jgi:DNA-binding HxlR family transcriptional regulator
MVAKRHGQRSDCPISYCLDTFGDRWTLLVLRDLMLYGKSRFGELQDGGEGIASNILADRLLRLEQQRLIRKRPSESDRRQFVYSVTPLALDLSPVLLEMAAWGLRRGCKGSPALAELVGRHSVPRGELTAELEEHHVGKGTGGA